jgi:6-pyruvoyltetrahydropterin/6-carboxytetrahydropterin synthase
MPERYHIRIEKERLVFSAAHFITYAGDVCEPLHGHNYQVFEEIEGPLDNNSYVVDFIAVRDALQTVVDKLDHRVLLPTQHPNIAVSESPSAEGGEVVATHGRRRWVFPRQDCVLLDVANTTAEMLATHIGQELLHTLSKTLPTPPDRVAVGVDECDGQWGVYEWTPAPR